MRSLNQGATRHNATAQSGAPISPIGPTIERAAAASRIAVDAARELAADGDPGAAWHWPWVLARRLRTAPGIERDTDPMLPAIQSAVHQAHEVLGDLVHETDFVEPGCLVAAVIAVWPKIVYADGEGPLELAIRRAAAMPVIPQPSIGTTYARLMAIAFHLQDAQGVHPILLPVHRIGAILRVSGAQVARLIQVAIRLGHLTVVDPSYRPGRVRRFRCDLRPTRLGPCR